MKKYVHRVDICERVDMLALSARGFVHSDYFDIPL